MPDTSERTARAALDGRRPPPAARRPAGMEPCRPLPGDGCARAGARLGQGCGRRRGLRRPLEGQARGPRPTKGAKASLGRCLRAYEALEELIGRIVSYAALIYAGNTTDPQRAKLYGDIQEKMTDAGIPARRGFWRHTPVGVRHHPNPLRYGFNCAIPNSLVLEKVFHRNSSADNGNGNAVRNAELRSDFEVFSDLEWGADQVHCSFRSMNRILHDFFGL